MDLIVLFLAFVIGWGVLRSMGGNGLDITIKFAPKSTKQGLRQRWIVAAVPLLWGASLLFVELHNGDVATAEILAISYIVAIPVVYVLYRRNRIQ